MGKQGFGEKTLVFRLESIFFGCSSSCYKGKKCFEYGFLVFPKIFLVCQTRAFLALKLCLEKRVVFRLERIFWGRSS